jgi:SAM-dependent methyltransferase
VTFSNAYDDPQRAASYAQLEFPGTYYLGFRDLPAIIAAHVSGTEALDFGCGAGRSTRFLKSLGFRAIGVDISENMLRPAAAADPDGTYICIGDGDLSAVGDRRFDLVLAAYPFDNIPDARKRRELMRSLRRLLTPAGRIILLGSAPELYVHEWTSFTTAPFPGNRTARSGDPVYTAMKDAADARPILDFFWTRADYAEMFAGAGLEVIEEHRPLGRSDEPFVWVSETTVSPWVIYVLRDVPPPPSVFIADET